MGAIRTFAFAVGVSIGLSSAPAWAQYPPPPAAPPGYPPPYPAQPYPPPPYGAPPYYAPPPYGAPQYYPPPGAYGYAPPPMRIPYREGESHPGYHIEENPIKGLVVSGFVVLLVPYALSAMIGLSTKSDSDRWLLLPVVGPFGDIASRSKACSDDVGCIFEPLVRTMLVMDGLMQSTGAILLVTGYLFPKREWVSDRIDTSGALPRLTAWSLSPRLFQGSTPGLALSGEIF